jgi:hypothetical protein
VAALMDKEPARRAAAAFVVGRAAAGQRKAVPPLLNDDDPAVRFHAAAALVSAGDRSGVPALIALLGDGPQTLAWQAEDILYRVAGSEATPSSLGSGDEAGRRKARKEWEGWWKVHGEKVDLARLKLDEPQQGLTLICDLNGGKTGMGRVWEVGRDGKMLWEMDKAQGPIDAHPLPGGRVLVAEHNGNRVTERNRKGDVLWEARLKNNPVACQRLPNGNTFIATYTELLEVTRDGKTVYSYGKAYGVYYALKLRNGHILYAHRNNQLVELDGAGKEVRTVPCTNTTSWLLRWA